MDAGDVAFGGGFHGGVVGAFCVEAGEGGGPVEGPSPVLEVGHAFGLFGGAVGGFDEGPGGVGGEVEVGAELTG